MEKFARILKCGLHGAGHEARLIRPHLFSSGKHGVRKWLGYVDRFLVFPHRLRLALSWADVVHVCDHANPFLIRLLRGEKYLVTCHDLTSVRSALGELSEHQ